MFRRRPVQPPRAPDVADTTDSALELDLAAEPSDAELSDQLSRIASRFGLQPWDEPGSSLAVAITQADGLWSAPRSGQVELGVNALFGGRPPATLIGAHLWPNLIQSGSGPALVLTDVRHRVHAVVDVAHTPSGRAPRPGWVASAAITYGARMPGSHQLWRRWQLELSDHTPHDWSPACDAHVHLARPNPQGKLVTGIPQHDAWVMSRSWLPTEFALPSTTDVRWIVLSASDRPVREREPQIRSQWDAVSFAEFASVLAAPHDADVALPSAVATVIRMMLPARDMLRP